MEGLESLCSECLSGQLVGHGSIWSGGQMVEHTTCMVIDARRRENQFRVCQNGA